MTRELAVGSHSNNQNSINTVVGSDISIPIVTPNITHRNAVATPEWMVMIDDKLSSTIDGAPADSDADLTKCCELLGWTSDLANITKGNTANALYATSAVQHSNVLIMIPNGTFIPDLETIMNSGANVAAIKIVRLGNITDLKVVLQVVTYTNCKIESIQQQLDSIVISFRPLTRKNMIIQYGQDGGKLGNNVSFFDYSTGKNAE